MTLTLSRTSRALFGKPMMAAALAFGGIAGMAAAPAAVAQEAEAQPELKPSRNFQKAFKPVYDGFQKANADPAITAKRNELNAAPAEQKAAISAQIKQMVSGELAALAALRDRIDNQSDRYIWGQYAINFGLMTGDADLQLEGITEETASGLQTRTRKAQLSNAKAMMLFDRGDYAGARATWIEAKNSGVADANIGNNIVVTYIREGNRAGALDYINTLIEEQAAVGTPSEELLIRAYSIAREVDATNMNQYAVNLVRYYPTERNWANAIILVRDGVSADDEAVLDLQRLMVRTDSVQNRGDVTAIIEYADYRKRPQEVLDAIEYGLAKGFLQANEPGINEERTAARKQVSTDMGGELDSLGSDARSAGATLTTMIAAGDAYLNYGRGADAEAIYRLALAKPGANTESLMTRIGIAQVEQGKFNEARATFDSITGFRSGVAQLWSVFAQQQGA